MIEDSGREKDRSRQTRSRPEKASPWTAWDLLLLLPYLGLLWPAFYARTEPSLFGFPFFYWYQFVWVPLSAVLTGLVFLATRKR